MQKRLIKKLKKEMSTRIEPEFNGSKISDMEALMAPYEKTKNFLKRVWENLHHQSRQSWLQVFIAIVVSIIITMTLTSFFLGDHRGRNNETFGLISRLETLKQSHDYYTTMATRDEMLVSWIKLFSRWEYRLGGDPRYNAGDCVGAVYEFLKKWDSNVHFENVKGIVQRVENLAARGEIAKRTSPGTVKHGDLIIIQMTRNQPEHVGIVYDVTNGMVRYMDVNAGTRTWGFEKTLWGSNQIYAIYSISYSFWIGPIMQQINDRTRQ